MGLDELFLSLRINSFCSYPFVLLTLIYMHIFLQQNNIFIHNNHSLNILNKKLFLEVISTYTCSLLFKKL